MKNQGCYRHLRVDWVGESCSESITLCGVEGEDIGTGQTLCPAWGFLYRSFPLALESPLPRRG